jgi:hypothetical protein
MLLASNKDRPPLPQSAVNRAFLSCDGTGCTLSGVNTERRFPDLHKALDYARRSSETEVVTIEIWQNGQYICCMPPRPRHHGEPDFPSIGGPSIVPSPWLMTVERYADRAARVLMATAGPFFWMALMFIAVAASLGWRLLFF